MPVARLVIAEHSVVVADVEMQRLYRLIERLARSELPLLVRGEPGAGKTTVARAVHAWSARANAPLLTLDCAAAPDGAPDGVIERELFGCERGAFASGSSRKPGLLERARGGTLVLDHVHQLAPAIQARLVHVLDHKRVLRIGGKHERPVDVRIIAMTSEDLAAAVAAGRFRRDLYDRLNAASLVLPPLRCRRRDIAVLAQQFLAAARLDAPVAISPAALAQLIAHAWPGNVRELEHAMAYAAALVDGDRVEPWHLPEPAPEPAHAGEPLASSGDAPAALDAPEPAPAAPPARPAGSFRPIAEELQALERRRMTEALRATGGVQRRAAELIGMPVRTFTFKLTQYGLRDGATPPPPSANPASRIARRRSRHATGGSQSAV
ncbi:MAG TPA: sigma 54-interacting transcriptional regulator [Kofleriaceae bacterium]|nr:sigma 54-interacting transcriptional regulator [Kofleriaceae bacterium]